MKGPDIFQGPHAGGDKAVAVKLAAQKKNSDVLFVKLCGRFDAVGKNGDFIIWIQIVRQIQGAGRRIQHDAGVRWNQAYGIARQIPLGCFCLIFPKRERMVVRLLHQRNNIAV